MTNKKKLVVLTDENQRDIEAIRRDHPELVTDISAIRFALKQAATPEEKSATIGATQGAKNDRLTQIAKAQDLNMIMLASMLREMKISVPAAGDLLDAEEITAAEKMRHRHLDSLRRDKRHRR
jgi:uncharacterized protein YnzC (UPF0291/DUF896 family)